MFENVEPQRDSVIFNSGWLTYLGVFAISIWGGMVSYLNRVGGFTWRSLFAQLSSSSFAGVMVFFACQYAGISGPLSGVLIGIGAHMGTPALIALAMKLKLVRNLLDEKAK